MRAVEWIKSRFEWSLKNKKPIQISKSDIEALNQIIEFCNGKVLNTDFEDALCLFWVFQFFKIEFDEKINFKKNNAGGIIEIPNIEVELDRLRIRLDSKKIMINNFLQEIQTKQLINGVKKENFITYEEVEEYINIMLLRFKNNNIHFKNLYKL